MFQLAMPYSDAYSAMQGCTAPLLSVATEREPLEVAALRAVYSTVYLGSFEAYVWYGHGKTTRREHTRVYMRMGTQFPAWCPLAFGIHRHHKTAEKARG